MRMLYSTFAMLSLVCMASTSQSELPVREQTKTMNAAIDFRGFLKLANEVQPYRAERCVSELRFLDMASEEGTVVLDTRSAEAFAKLHVTGAVHLNFSDITKERLDEVIPDLKTRVLIYCNNNFQNRPVAFALKRAPAALNIPTFITLYEYGYRDLYELGPAIDADETILPLSSSADDVKQDVELTRKQ